MTSKKPAHILGLELPASPVVIPFGGPMEMRLETRAQPRIAFDRHLVEQSLKVTLPLDILRMWQEVSELRLFEDVQYGQWGLVLWPPDRIVQRNREHIQDRPEQFVAGDLLLGEFLGDSDLLMVRSDQSEFDFGSVQVALAIYPRSNWFRVGNTLFEFLKGFIASGGRKYWEHSA